MFLLTKLDVKRGYPSVAISVVCMFSSARDISLSFVHGNVCFILKKAALLLYHIQLSVVAICVHSSVMRKMRTGLILNIYHPVDHKGHFRVIKNRRLNSYSGVDVRFWIEKKTGPFEKMRNLGLLFQRRLLL